MYINIFLLFSVHFACAFIAFDCGGPGSNITTLSLVDKPDCVIEHANITYEERYAVITQSLETESVNYIRCSIQVSHIVYECGTFTDSVAQKGYYSEIIHLSKEECNTLHNDKLLKLYNRRYQMINDDHQFSDTTMGGFSKGSCIPAPPITINGITWEKPIRNSVINVIINKGSAMANYEDDSIVFPKGVKCVYTSQHCYHYDMGDLYWTNSEPLCDLKVPRGIVFSGISNVVTRITNTGTNKYVMVKSGDKDFQILLKETETHLCGFTTHYTEHPQLYVTFMKDPNYFPIKKGVTDQSLDMNLYVNSKFVLVMRHIHAQVDRLFLAFQRDRCAMTSKILDNYLTLAFSDPINFAYQLYGRPGYTAVVRGEAIYVSQCAPVIVSIKPTNQVCFNEIPVLFNNKSMFVTPRNRLLVKDGSLTDCSSTLAPLFKINDGWFTPSVTGLTRTHTPQMVTMEFSTYAFEEIADIGSGGIYTPEAISSMRRTLLSPVYEQVINSRLITSLENGATLPEGYSVVNTITENELNILTTRVGNFFTGFYKKAMDLGSFISSIVGLYLLFKIILSSVSSIVNFKALMAEFGICTAFCCFWWTDMTNHLLSGNVTHPRQKVQEEELEVVFHQPTTEKNIYPDISHL